MGQRKDTVYVLNSVFPFSKFFRYWDSWFVAMKKTNVNNSIVTSLALIYMVFWDDFCKMCVCVCVIPRFHHTDNHTAYQKSYFCTLFILVCRPMVRYNSIFIYCYIFHFLYLSLSSKKNLIAWSIFGISTLLDRQESKCLQVESQ